jgi:hypothetical protein
MCRNRLVMTYVPRLGYKELPPYLSSSLSLWKTELEIKPHGALASCPLIRGKGLDAQFFLGTL